MKVKIVENQDDLRQLGDAMPGNVVKIAVVGKEKDFYIVMDATNGRYRTVFNLQTCEMHEIYTDVSIEEYSIVKLEVTPYH